MAHVYFDSLDLFLTWTYLQHSPRFTLSLFLGYFLCSFLRKNGGFPCFKRTVFDVVLGIMVVFNFCGFIRPHPVFPFLLPPAVQGSLAHTRGTNLYGTNLSIRWHSNTVLQHDHEKEFVEA